MDKIGFLGLGAMGLPIAENLLKAGHPLYVGYHHNRTPAERLAEQGAVLCEAYKEVAASADVVFTILPDAPQVEAALFAAGGLAEGLRPGAVVFDMSTIDLTRSREFAQRLGTQGVHFFDAPVSGGPKGAQAATMAIMVGGKRELFERYRPLLETIGKSIVYCGDSGLGLAAKMANNLITAAQTVAISEALSLAVKAGIDPDALYEVLKGATANSFILNSKVPAFLKDNYNPGFKLSLMCKDLHIITGVAKKLGTPVMVGGLVEQIFNLCKEEHGEKDSGAVSLFYQQQAGVSFVSRQG
jgi:2-hydroxy-3-oxopropionate reductase